MMQYRLIYAILQNEDLDTLLKVSDSFLDTKAVPYVEFVRNYYARFGKLPSVDTLEQKFNVALPSTNDSADFWLQEVIGKHKEAIIEDCIKKSAKDRKNALKYMQDAIVAHNIDTEPSIIDYGADYQGRLKRYAEVKGTGGITYLSTGENEIDTATKGYKKKDLWTIGGREGIGKTWRLLRMANSLDAYMLSKKIEKPILFFSNEMDNEECSDRLDSIRAKLSYDKIISGALDAKEEFAFARKLRGINSNIKIIDNAMSLADVSAYIDLYGPACVFIDGAHLLAQDFEWQTLFKLTANLKKITRSKKVPIINTTHIKSGKGKTAGGGDIDDFAYAKGFTRDSDVAAIMYASPDMELDDEFGLHFLKIRRSKPCKILYKQDWKTMENKIIEVITNMAAVVTDEDDGKLSYKF